MSSFCICKINSHFFSKNMCELDIVLTRKVNIVITNKLFKLMLWTNGPWQIIHVFYYNNSSTWSWYVKYIHLSCNVKKHTFGHVNPAKIHIRIVWSESSLGTFWIAKFPHADKKTFWSDCMDADLSLCWAHMSEGMFSHVAAHLYKQCNWKFWFVLLPCEYMQQWIKLIKS